VRVGPPGALCSGLPHSVCALYAHPDIGYLLRGVATARQVTVAEDPASGLVLLETPVLANVVSVPAARASRVVWHKEIGLA